MARTSSEAQNKEVRRAIQRLLAEGLACGMLAGSLFGIAVVASAMTIFDRPLVTPIRRVASIIVGDAAFFAHEGRVIVIGVMLHLALSAVFGLLYAALNLFIVPQHLKRYGWQALLGTAFGVGLWLVNFHLIARFAFPSLAAVPQLAAALLHAFAYGLPLGLMLALAERQASVAFAAFPLSTASVTMKPTKAGT